MLSSGLTLALFNNTALLGPALKQSVVALPTATIDGMLPFSATMTGTLAVERGISYNFSCYFGGASLGYVHIDGHLVCQTGVNHPHAPGGPDVISTAYDTPLPVLAATAWPIRFTIVHNGSNPAPEVSFGLDITRLNVTSTADPDANATAIMDHDHDWLQASLVPELPPAEVERDAMQQELARGWGSWYDMSFTKLIRLPEGSALNLVLCEPSPNATVARCLTQTRIDYGPADSKDVGIRLGAHAYDRSYMQLYLATPGCNVSMTVGGGAELLALVEVVDGCDSAELVLVGGIAWHRLHHVYTPNASSLAFEPYGDNGRASVIHSTVSASGTLPLPPDVGSEPHLALILGARTPIGISSTAPLSAAAIREKLEAAWATERSRYDAFGEHAEVKMAVQAGVMWNVVYNPLERVLAPVIRGNPFGWDVATVDDDWPYVLFDWDSAPATLDPEAISHVPDGTHFAAYMLSLDARALGYSVLIQIVKAKAANGFVPNGWAPTRKSTHSQPPVGSKVLLEMYRKYADEWLVSLLFDDLLDWSNWFDANRRLPPLGLTALGGDDMQAARYESGLDNSPMYDGEFFMDRPGEPLNGLMTMYDVGMGSIVAMSDEALAELADVLGRAADAAMLRVRAREQRQKIADHLWDEASGAYVNRFANGSFYRRISPTSFYPMLAGAASSSTATSLMSRWLLNSSRFCIAPAGDFGGNADSCYWGLPSISADDPAFPRLGYWRGFVWGPMALLTYWGLAAPAYAAVPLVAQARAALCKQMGALLLSQWRLNRHVCENFSPKKNATECTGMHFYHWGALTGFIGLLEAGFYAKK